jgi:beta-lactamase regulating signal transducer with metallopeptidase domain
MAYALLAVAWLLTYLLHSTILLGGAWLLSSARLVRAPVVKDALWKVCLVGGLVTATVQTALPREGFGRRFWLPDASAQQAQMQMPTAALAAPAQTAAPAGAATPGPSAARPWSRVSSGASVARAPRTVAEGDAPVTASAPTSEPQAPSPSPGWPLLLLGVWLLGAAAFLARLAFRRARFCRRLGERRELTGGPLVEALESLVAAAGIRRRIRLAVSPELSAPVAMGTSEICLPERVQTALGPAEQRAVLAHELGHLVRRDPTWLALGVVLENLLFVQPLNRLARRRAQEAAEYLCDDWAARQTGGLTLARCLAEVATWLQGPRRPVPVSGMAENRSQLVERVRRLLDGVEPRAARGLRLAVPVAALALSTVAFAAPGVLPPCDAGPELAAANVAHPGVEPAAPGGGPHTWATIRGGRLLTFRSGFAPRIRGQGRLGIRRGGLAIEAMDGQHITLNGRRVGEGEDVSVCETDTVRIVDEGGRTVWTLEPVWISTDDSNLAMDDEGAPIVAGDRDDVGEPADSAASLGVAVAGVVDVEALAAATSEIASAGERLGHEIGVKLSPRLAQLRRMSERMAVKTAPRLARMGVRVAASVAPAVNRALRCAACAAPPRSLPGRRHRGIDGTKRLRP